MLENRLHGWQIVASHNMNKTILKRVYGTIILSTKKANILQRKSLDITDMIVFINLYIQRLEFKN